MPALLLNRQCTILDTGDASVAVVCEPSRRTPRAWCAAIRPDPENGLRMWHRDFLTGQADELEGREVVLFLDPPPGFYEARSTRTARESQSVCFVVTTVGEIAILDDRGDENRVIAALNGLTPAQFEQARRTWNHDYLGPPLVGSPRQVAYAAAIRERIVSRASLAGDHDLTAHLNRITDASWFIANRGRSFWELWSVLIREGWGPGVRSMRAAPQAEDQVARRIPSSGRSGPGHLDRGRGGP